MKKIAVVGAGYVGLVTGACFAQKDNAVIIIENNQDKIDLLLNKQIPFYEPGLNDYVQNGIAMQTLTFVNTIEKALCQHPEIIFLCVGTPSSSTGAADLSQVWTVAEEIGKHLSNYCVIVTKSTVPVGTSKKVEAIIQEQLQIRSIDVPFDVASNPEFLKEGDAINDFIAPDRVVVGTSSILAEQILYNLYKPFLSQKNQFITMNCESSELTKYAANAMLATRISFINQIALLADKVGADIDQVKNGIAQDKRIGQYFLNAGIGYGGSCFPKDVKALIHMGIEHNQSMTLIKEVDHTNTRMRMHFIEKIINHYEKNNQKISQKNIGLWGLAFKPETDDIRYAPSIDVIQKLLEKGAKITVYDPIATSNIQKIFSHKITYASSAESVLQICDFLIILTEWKEFKQITLDKFLQLNDKTIFDGRNCYDPAQMAMAGIQYYCIGKNIKSEERSIQSQAQTATYLYDEPNT